MARFVVEGAIGSGKSSTLEALRLSHPEWLILPEPITEWEQYSPCPGRHYNLLRDFYDRPGERNFRLLQYQVVQSLLDRYTKAARDNPGAVTVFERSLRVAHEVFLEENKAHAATPEFYQLKALCTWGVEHFERDLPSVYLTCSTPVMVERVVQRSRPSEREMSLTKLVAIKERMDRWAESHRLHRVDTSELTPHQVSEAVVAWREGLPQ